MVVFQDQYSMLLYCLIGAFLSLQTEACQVSCNDPLGLGNGLITDSQILGLNAYNDDTFNYGAKFARLKGKRGYRGKQGKGKSAWITIDLRKPVVLTEISTQGYGDQRASEWVTKFQLFYAANSNDDYKYYKDHSGAQMTFQGNKDRNSIRSNTIPLPVVAWRIMLVPVSWHNNVGLRMELYGCDPGYAFNVWMMTPGIPFTMDFFNSSSQTYIENAYQMISEINANMLLEYGFLSAKLMRFSPQKSTNLLTYAAAEIKIDCLPKREQYLIGKLKALQKKSPQIFYPDFFEFQYTRSCDCPPPIITIQGLNKSILFPTVVYRSERILKLESTVKFRCNRQKKFFISWESSALNNGLDQLSPIRDISQKISTKPRQVDFLSIGLFRDAKEVYVRCKVQMLAVPGAISYDFAFFKPVTPPLKVNITGKRAFVKNKEAIVLNGSQSVDPMTIRSGSKFLKFTWFCKKNGEQFPKNATSYVDIANTNSVPSSSGGCFGFGPGKLSIRKVTLRLDTNRMDVGDYIFKLTISKGPRMSSITYNVTLVPPASVNISCVKCNKEITWNERITFDVKCFGDDCPGKPNYQWRVYQRKNTLPNQWMKLENVSSTKAKGGSRFAIESLKNQLQTSHVESLTLKVEVLLMNDSNSLVAKGITFFNVNRGPRLLNSNTGGCFVSPSRGIGISTMFVLHCRGWYDEHLPLNYRFVYYGQFSTVIFHSGPEPNVSTTLPPGQETDGYNLKLEVVITDARGSESEAQLVLKVEPSTSLEDFKKRFRNFTETAGSLLNNGDTDATAEIALALIQTAEKIFENESNIQNQLKDDILTSIEHIKLKTLPQITKVVAVVASATNQTGTLSKRAREKAINLLQRSVSAMARNSNEKISNLKIISNISAAVLLGIGQIISSSNADNDSESRNDTKQAVEITNAIADTMVSLKEVGDPPSVVRSKTIDILVYRAEPADISGKAISEGNSGVQLPSKEVLFGKIGSVPYVDFQMIMHSKNPYTWDSASNLVTSGVLDVNLKLSSGKMSVSNLEKPIGITVATKKMEASPTTGPKSKYFAKPSNGSDNLRYHSFNLDSELHTVEFKIVPDLGVALNVYVRSGQRPTTQHFNLTKRIPDFTQCNSSQNDILTECSTDPFVIRITSKATGNLGIHYLGIQYFMGNSNSIDNDTNQKVRSLRVRRDCEGSSRRKKRSCVGVKDAPTTPAPTPMTIIPVYNASTDVNYTLTSSVSFCGYWSEEKEKWTTDGCKVGENLGNGKINCLCNHLSAFGGDFFVAPNPIDFDKVFLEFGRLGETGNYVVLSTVCVLWALYVIGLLVARRADVLDKKKVVIQVLPYEGDCSSTYQYKVSIETGMWFGNGTTADVSIAINGSMNTSGPIQLTNSETDKYYFCRSSVNTFIISLPYSLGNIYQVKVQHDNGGSDPSWFLKDIIIFDMSSDEKWFFVANRWIAVHKHDGKLECTIQDTKTDGKIGFKSAFHSRVSKKLGESHLWISLFSRPPQNPFTRCQRLSCCLSIIFAAMVTNAMFYRFGIESKDTIHIGSFKISWTEIKIGMQSALIAIPVNILLVLIFKNIKHSHRRTEDGEVEPGAQSSGILPRFFLYIAWVLCLSIAAVSSAFVVFYSLQWGASTSNQWLKSIMVSLVEDTCVIQPVKIVLLAFLLSLILRRPVDHDAVSVPPLKAKRIQVKGTTSQPSSEELENSRRFKSQKLKLTLALIEIALFVIFIILLIIVVYGNRGTSRFDITECLEKTFKEFKKVRDLAMFWDWAKNRFVQEVYNVTWYNNKAFDGPEGFISNRDMFLVGMPRLRQIRIKQEPLCLDGMNLIEILHFKRCISSYSASKEQTSKYNLIGWVPIINSSSFHSVFNLEKVCPKPWRYHTARELSALPFGGGASVYYGGGFVADLGYNLKTAQKVLKNLDQNRWIDDLTVAVLVEFTIFEPSSQLFSSVRLLCERLPTGGLNLISKFHTIPVYFRKAGSSNVSQIFLPLFMIVVILLFVVELVRICKGGVNYFQEVWNWFSLFQCFGSMATVVIFFFKQKYTTAFVKRIQENPYETTSSDILILWSDVETYVLSFVIFVTTVKCLRLIRFNRHVCQMTTTLKISGKFLSSYMVSFVLLILAFTEIASTCFGSVFLTYSTFIRTVGTLLQQLIGGRLYFTAIRSIDPVLGPIYTFSYIFVANVFLINMFIAILNECYSTVRRSSADHFADAELGGLLITTLRDLRDQTIIKAKIMIKNLLSRKRGAYEVSGKKDRCHSMSTANLRKKLVKFKRAFHDKKLRGGQGYYNFKVIEDRSGYCFQVIPTEVILDCDYSDILGISYRPLSHYDMQGARKEWKKMPVKEASQITSQTPTPRLPSFDSDSSLSKVHKDTHCIPIAQKEDPNIGESDYEDESTQLENIKGSLLDIKSCLMSLPSFSSSTNDSAYENSSGLYWEPFSDSENDDYFENFEGVISPHGRLSKHHI